MYVNKMNATRVAKRECQGDLLPQLKKIYPSSENDEVLVDVTS